MRVSFAAGVEGSPYAYRLQIDGSSDVLGGVTSTTWYIVDGGAQPSEAFVATVADAVRGLTGISNVTVFRVAEELVV